MPSLIGSSNGKPKRVDVLGPSHCSRCKIPLSKGQICIEIPKLGNSFSNPKRYCDECYQSILQKTEQDLEELKKL